MNEYRRETPGQRLAGQCSPVAVAHAWRVCSRTTEESEQVISALPGAVQPLGKIHVAARDAFWATQMREAASQMREARHPVRVGGNSFQPGSIIQVQVSQENTLYPGPKR